MSSSTAKAPRSPSGAGPSRGRRPSLAAALGWVAACGISFVFGLFVGRQTAPIPFDLHQLERHLLTLRDEVVDQRQKALDTYFDATSDQTHLTFPDSLKGTAGGGGGEAPMAEADEAPEAAQAGPVRVLRKMPGLKPKSARKSTVVRARPKPPAPPAAKVSGGTVTIQVAALSRVEDADRMVAQLKAEGFEAYKTVARIKDQGVRIRVRVGAFADEAAASGSVKALKAKGYRPMVVGR